MKRIKVKQLGSVCLAGILAMAMTLPSGIAFADTAVGSQTGSIAGAGSATVVTGEDGTASIQIAIAQAGNYVIGSTASEGVDGDTVGTLRDSSGVEVATSDDNQQDTNFCISTYLDAGSYTLEVVGKEFQEAASITVSVDEGVALNTLDYKYALTDEGQLQSLELGTWVKGETTVWQAIDTASYQVVGFADLQIFAHAQQDCAVDKLQWASTIPSANGRFVMKVAAAGSAYVGAAYYEIDNVDTKTALSELFPKITNQICGAVSLVQLGTETNTPTSWKVEWCAISSSDYTFDGYTTVGAFEQSGGDTADVVWTKSLPSEVGRYVLKLSATAKSDYEGVTYVWTSIDETSHAGTGSWIIDKQATTTVTGLRHLVCAYCGSPCDYTTIEKVTGLKVGATAVAGSGATKAQYKVKTESEVTYLKCKSTKKTATVPATVKLGGATYYVTGISSKAFAKSKKVKTVTVKTKYLVKSTMKKCLKSSKVTTVKVPKTVKKAYKKLFVKKVCGKKVKVK